MPRSAAHLASLPASREENRQRSSGLRHLQCQSPRPAWRHQNEPAVRVIRFQHRISELILSYLGSTRGVREVNTEGRRGKSLKRERHVANSVVFLILYCDIFFKPSSRITTVNPLHCECYQMRSLWTPVSGSRAIWASRPHDRWGHAIQVLFQTAYIHRGRWRQHDSEPAACAHDSR